MLKIDVTRYHTKPTRKEDGPRDPEPKLYERLLRYLDKHDNIFLPAPAVIIVILMLIFPVAFTIYLSFQNWSGGLKPPVFIGIENYVELLNSSRFWNSLVNTGYFVVLSIISQVVLGIIAALVFNQDFIGRGLARSLYMFPMIATPAAMGLVWKMMLDPTIGSINYVMGRLGLPQGAWTANPTTVIPTLAIIDTWMWTPLVMLIVLAGLSALPPEPLEAAKVDGASKIQSFFYVTLPLLRPTLVVATMFRIIDCIKTFDIILVITGGGPNYSSEILNIYAYNESLSYLNFGYGSALLVVLAVIVFGIGIIFNRFRRIGYWS